jgi:hypothetical protein
MVKKLRVQLLLKDVWDGPRFPHWVNMFGSFSSIWVRVSLAALFEGILQKADVELNIVVPTTHRRRTNHGQASGSADEEYQCLRRIVTAFAPLGTAKTLKVTTDSATQKTVTDEHCQKLRIHIGRYVKKNDLKQRPPWRP